MSIDRRCSATYYVLTILLPGVADADGRLKALLDWSCFLPDLVGEADDDTDVMEASDRRLTAADSTGIVMWSSTLPDDDDNDDDGADRR